MNYKSIQILFISLGIVLFPEILFGKSMVVFPAHLHLNVSANYARGFNLTGYNKVKNLQAYSNSYYLNIGFQNSYPFNRYDTMYRFPIKSFIVGYTELPAIESTVGKLFYVIPNFETQWGNDKFNYYLELGLGLGLCTKPYHPIDNIKNKAIGGVFNIALSASTGMKLKIVDKIYFNLGLNFLHLSSAASSLPNSGLNMLGITTGIHYKFDKIVTRIYRDKESNLMVGDNRINQFNNDQNFYHKKKFYLAYLAAYKKEGKFGEKSFMANGLTFSYFPFNKKKIFHVGFGSDFYYDPSLSYFTYKELEKGFSSKKIQFGLNSNFNLDYKKVSMLGALGYYIYNPASSTYSRLYQKVGVLFHLKNHFTIGTVIKAKNFSADHLEIQVGYRF